MNKSPKISNILLKNIKNNKNGLALSDLIKLHPNVARRTLQRWISQLVQTGQISVQGQKRNSRYFAIDLLDSKTSPPADLATHAFPDKIPISLDSKEVLAYINQPLLARKPVGYHYDFLESYEPNKTRYLSEPLCRQLRNMGDMGQSKLPGGTYGKDILNRFLIDLSWASSHLEGNTYSRLDTRELIQHGKIAEGKEVFETQMILNHKRAIELLVEHADSVGFNRYTIFNIHSALSENLLSNSEDEGRIRQHIVEIGQSTFRPLSIPFQLEEFLNLILSKASQIQDPFEQSFFAMVHLPYLQAFADINKRTSRLMANLPLIKANLCPLTFLGVSEAAYSRAILGVYELNRVELLRDVYVWAYERSTQEYQTVKQQLVEPDPLRLAHRDLIKQALCEVVTQAQSDPLVLIKNRLQASLNNHEIKETDFKNIEALIIQELRRLHEGVLSRYGLKISEFKTWKSTQK